MPKNAWYLGSNWYVQWKLSLPSKRSDLLVDVSEIYSQNHLFNFIKVFQSPFTFIFRTFFIKNVPICRFQYCTRGSRNLSRGVIAPFLSFFISEKEHQHLLQHRERNSFYRTKTCFLKSKKKRTFLSKLITRLESFLDSKST